MLKAKSPIMKWTKRAGLLMFALVFALNVQVMFNQEPLNSNGNISLLGMEVNLFKNAIAEENAYQRWWYMGGDEWGQKNFQCHPDVYTSNCWPVWAWKVE